MVQGFRVNPQGMAKLLQSPQGLVWRDIHRRANNVLNLARVKCPVDQGKLRQSLAVEMRSVNGQPVGRVGTNVEYALYVHEGTGLYGERKRMIVPVNRKALRWATVNNSGRGRRRYKAGATGAYTFSKYSRGFPGRPFLRDALNQVAFR